MATVFCDDNKKYLSTDLCSDEECKEHYHVNNVELLDFRVIPPVTIAEPGMHRGSAAARRTGAAPPTDATDYFGINTRSTE